MRGTGVGVCVGTSAHRLSTSARFRACEINHNSPTAPLAMSRRVATVEDFDDDTDIPLPSHALPNTGRRGPILEQIGGSDGEDDEDEDDDALDMMHEAGPASPSQAAFKQAQAQMRASAPQAMDMTPYKRWVHTTLSYPRTCTLRVLYGQL